MLKNKIQSCYIAAFIFFKLTKKNKGKPEKNPDIRVKPLHKWHIK